MRNVAQLELTITHGREQVAFDVYPLQGLWTEAQYLKLSNQNNALLEYTDGVIEVLPMPTTSHQAIVRLIFLAMLAVVERLGGDLFFAPLRVQVRPGKFREPDLLLVLSREDPRKQDDYWRGADLVVEVVSPDDPERDTVDKVQDYAEARIPEYWIVNPITHTITVLALDGETYSTHGTFRRGDVATSRLLAGFALPVETVFARR